MNSKNYNNISHPHSHPTNLLEENLTLKKKIEELSQAEHKHKLTISDYEFEIKRLNEDFATFKTMTELEQVKRTKDYDSKVGQLKRQIEEDNQNWIRRFEIRDKELKNEMQAFKNKVTEQKQHQEVHAKKHYEQIEYQVKEEKEKAIAAIEKKTRQEMAKTKQEAEKKVTEAVTECDKKIKATETKAVELMEKAKKEHELKLAIVESEKQSEENMHNNTRKELQNTKEKLYQELYVMSRQKQVLQEELTQVQKKNKELEATVLGKNEYIQQMQKQHEEQAARLKRECAAEIQSAKKEFEMRVAGLIQKQLAKAEELDQSMRDLEFMHNEQTEQYSVQVEQMKSCYNERPSRNEDLQAIKQLEDKLWKKENDFELVVQELKWHRLELENKEETYNKIFTNGYNINEIKFPLEKLRTLHKEFKFRKIAKSLLKEKESKNLNNSVRGPVPSQVQPSAQRIL